jgi:hypothetical protein
LIGLLGASHHRVEKRLKFGNISEPTGVHAMPLLGDNLLGRRVIDVALVFDGLDYLSASCYRRLESRLRSRGHELRFHLAESQLTQHLVELSRHFRLHLRDGLGRAQ